jgi:UDP:flavonoid glycosyltransferase YjiC (YdhE family)
MRKKKVLFVAEAVTLAHVARPLALSVALDPASFDIAFACDPRARGFLRDFSGCYLPLRSVSSDRFLNALAKGAPL